MDFLWVFLPMIAVMVAGAWVGWQVGFGRGWDQASDLWRRWNEEEERKTKNAEGRANVAESKIERVLTILEE